MPESFFSKERNIHLSKNAAPVLLAHKRGPAHSERFFLHLNHHIEIYIYISGDTDYIVEDHYIPLEHGDIVVILPNEVHVPVIKAPGVYERFYMLIPLDAFSDFGFDPLTQYCSVKGHKIALPPEKKKEFLSLLYQISDLLDAEDTQGTRLLTAGLLLQVQGVLSTFKSKQNTPTEIEIPSEIPKHLRDILKHIGLHAQEIHSVEAIAKHFYISPQYLSTLFKKYVGVNVNQYLRIKKIALAKGFLENGSSVAEACYECGFSDSSHFIKNFKQYVGMTPKQYKNRVLKKTL
ncbi:MAG: helix-turn-helix domain-containing protein [Clostridia bacterium]|nr:helix-turn-helix domain-containing protein [Clostridia bacterium]